MRHNKTYTPKAVELILKGVTSKYWCKSHITGRVGVNKTTGAMWRKCHIGFRKNESCDITSE